MRKNLKRLRILAEAHKTLDTRQLAVAIVNWAVGQRTAAKSEGSMEPAASAPDAEAAE